MSSLRQSSQTNNKNNPSYVSSEQISSEEASPIFYLQSFPINNMSNYLVSSFYSEKILAGIDILIHLGAVEVSKKRKTVDELMDKAQIKQEQRLIIEEKKKKQFIQKQLEILNKQMKPDDGQDLQDPYYQNGLILSKEQHKAIVDKFKRQFMERSKRHQQLVQQMIQRIKDEEQDHRKDFQQRKKVQLQFRRQQIDQKLQQNKRKKEQMRIFELKSNEKIKQIYKNKDKIQLRYRKQVVLPLIEQKQKKIKQIHQQKSLNFEQIKQHQKDYLQKKTLNQSRRTIFRQEWRYIPPPRSERLTVIMQMQALEKVKKSEQKKAKLQQNLAKNAQYASYLRRNFIPKIDIQKKQELQQRIQRLIPDRAESLDARVLGKVYLQEVKRKRKKTIKIQDEPYGINSDLNKEQASQTHEKQQKGNYPSTIQPKINIIDHYYQSKRQKIKKVINNSQINSAQKIKWLSLQTDKLDSNIKSKESELLYRKDEKIKQQALQLLLSSIEAKIGIIETCG